MKIEKIFKSLLVTMILFSVVVSCHKDQSTFYMIIPEKEEISGQSQNLNILVKTAPPFEAKGAIVSDAWVSYEGEKYKMNKRPGGQNVEIGTVSGPCFKLLIPLNVGNTGKPLEMQFQIEENNTGKPREFVIDVFFSASPCKITQMPK